MPIHRIDLPHIDSNSQLISPSTSPNLVPSNEKNSHFSNIENNSISSVNLSVLSSITLEPISSSHSFFSTITATTEYSKKEIDSECGDLLKINNDLDVDGNFQELDYSKLHLNLDSDSENDFNLNDSLLLKRVKTSTSICGTCNNNSEIYDFNDCNVWNFKEKWAIVLIGLPACGKSTIVENFINYAQKQTNNKLKIKSYNAGEIRRIYQNQNKNKLNFNDLNSSKKLRDSYAFKALENLNNDLLNDVIDIGILDATNTTVERRNAVFNQINTFSKQNNIIIKPLLFEVKCSNKALRRFNIEQKSKNKDYFDMKHDDAINDFFQRIYNYEKTYEKVTTDEIKALSVKYFGIDNVGDTIYYDCGLQHHSGERHQNLNFKSLCLNLLYQFLIQYRVNYANSYLSKVQHFYSTSEYKPIVTKFSKPVTDEEIDDVKSVKTNGFKLILNQDTESEKVTHAS